MIVLATICFTIALVYIFTQDTQKSDDVENKGKLTEEVAKTEQDYSYIFEAFRDCVRPKIEHLKGNYDQVSLKNLYLVTHFIISSGIRSPI